MKHHASPEFWARYRRLPAGVQGVADRAFALLKRNPAHPSLHLKRVGKYWSVRVGLHYRALGIEVEGGLLWFWIGSHDEYESILK